MRLRSALMSYSRLISVSGRASFVLTVHTRAAIYLRREPEGRYN